MSPETNTRIAGDQPSSKEWTLHIFFHYEDVCYIVLSYLDSTSLCRLDCTSRFMHSLKTEYVWKILVKRRWRCNDNVLKLHGAKHWKMVHEIFHLRQRIPKGVYSSKDNVVFGRGRHTGSPSVDSWLLLGHTVDARVNRKKCIELRVMYQCMHDLLSIALECENFTLKCLSEEKTHLTILPIVAVRIIALNGAVYDGGDNGNKGTVGDQSGNKSNCLKEICLNILDTCVLALDIFIEDDAKIIYETDFLARAHSLSYKLQSSTPMRLPTSSHLQDEIVTSFYQDLYYADHYDELPGGVVLLRGQSGWGR